MAEVYRYGNPQQQNRPSIFSLTRLFAPLRRLLSLILEVAFPKAKKIPLTARKSSSGSDAQDDEGSKEKKKDSDKDQQELQDKIQDQHPQSPQNIQRIQRFGPLRKVGNFFKNLLPQAGNFLSQTVSRLAPNSLLGRAISSLGKNIFSKGISNLIKGVLPKLGGLAARFIGMVGGGAISGAGGAAAGGGAAAAGGGTAAVGGGVISAISSVLLIILLVIILVILLAVFIVIVIMVGMRDFESTPAGAPLGTSNYVSITKTVTVDGVNTLQVTGKKLLSYTITAAPKADNKLTNVVIKDTFTSGINLLNSSTFSFYDPAGVKFYDSGSPPPSYDPQVFAKYWCGGVPTTGKMCFKLDKLESSVSFRIDVSTNDNLTDKDSISNQASVEGFYSDPPDPKKTALAWATVLINAGPDVIIANVPYIHEYASLDDTDKPNVQWTACGPASLTMALNYAGVSDRLSVVARKLSDAGIYSWGNLTVGQLSSGPALWGKKMVVVENSPAGIYNALKDGHPVVINVGNYNNKEVEYNDPARGGHFMVVVGIKGFDGEYAKSLIINDDGYDGHWITDPANPSHLILDPSGGDYKDFPYVSGSKTQIIQTQPTRGPYTNYFKGTAFYVE
ncbi:MAG: C39 family peptidase [Patescibacteria group bacterium]|nr:C39 family peptidase [Patescibacteria group bacterium]